MWTPPPQSATWIQEIEGFLDDRSRLGLYIHEWWKADNGQADKVKAMEM